LVVDRLRASALGAYGATWGETPRLDRLAVESLVCDFALVDQPTIAGFYRAAWRGGHALQGERPSGVGSQPALPTVLAGGGVRCVLVTDEPDLVGLEMAGLEMAADWDDRVLSYDVDSPWAEMETPSAPAKSIAETEMARWFATTIDQLERLAEEGSPFCLWAHGRGMGGPWDGPVELRNGLVDPDDPPPPQGVEPPRRWLQADHDPDEVFGAACCYFGQVALLDTCVGLLLDQLAATGLDDSTLVVLVGARGFPLGEHRRLGLVDDALLGETLHVPLLLRYPGGASLLKRSPALVHPADLYATLCDWFGQTSRVDPVWSTNLATLLPGDDAPPRDRICMELAGERAIRIPGWFLRTPSGEPPQLFVKPDDRFEANDVANRCEEVVDALVGAWDALADLAAGRSDVLPPLADELSVAPM
jgi:arylsulfatase A-like enzyme